MVRFAIVDTGAIVYVRYAAGTDVLALFDEALRLLPEPRRWVVTFNTYLTEAPAAPCAWRGQVAGTPAAAMAKGNVLDLTNLNPADLPSGPLADAARTGHAVEAALSLNDYSPEPASTTSAARNLPIPNDDTLQPTISAAAIALAASAHRTQRGPVISSNVLLNDSRPKSSGSKAAVVISIAASVMLCATGVGMWLKTGEAVGRSKAEEVKPPARITVWRAAKADDGRGG